jgi:thioredoxin
MENNMSNDVIHLTSESFDKVINEGITVVDFWAEWCGPCRMQGPILDEVVKKVGDKATISKLNVDDNQEISQKYGITGIPTMLIFKDGEIAKTMVGVQSEEILVAAIEELS